MWIWSYNWAKSTILSECYGDTPGIKEIISSIIRMYKEFHGKSFNLNHSPARSVTKKNNNEPNPKTKKLMDFYLVLV